MAHGRTVSITAVGAASPRFRLDVSDVARAWGGSGRGAIALCGADEDTLTLAWDAVTAALGAAGLKADDIGGLWWGTSRPPFSDGPSYAYLAAALDLDTGAAGGLHTGSAQAGMDALFAAWEAIAAGTVRNAVVVASDAQRPAPGTPLERRAGAAAAALVLASGEGPATLRGRSMRTRPVLDRYRGDADTEVRDVYDSRAIREQVFVPEVTAAVEALQDDAAIPRWSLPELDGRTAASIAHRLGADLVSQPVIAEIGDAGAAAALLGLLPALDAPGLVGAVAYGGGRTAGVSVSVSDPVPGAASVLDALTGAARIDYLAALRARGQLVAGVEPIPMGVPPGGAGFLRGNPELLALRGARCVDCGTISTPPSVHPTCTGCGGGKLEEVSLIRTGTVHTFVVNEVMPPPFEAPLPLVVADLDDGARLMVQAVGDGSDLDVGTRVRLVLRRYATERGAPVYGYKAVPDKEGR